MPYMYTYTWRWYSRKQIARLYAHASKRWIEITGYGGHIRRLCDRGDGNYLYILAADDRHKGRCGYQRSMATEKHGWDASRKRM